MHGSLESKNMLRLEKLSRNWDTFSLKNISLEITRGKYFVLLGPCGCGKTLLLGAIAGIYRLDSGKIFIDSEEMTHLTPEKRKVGYLFQKNTLFPHLGVKENIFYGLKYIRTDEAYIKRICDLLDIGDLLLRKDTLNLSGGQAQKIALARSLVLRPRLLLLDEPLHSLDPAGREKVLGMLKSVNKDLGLTLLHVTHDLEEARQLADDACVMIDGGIVQNGRVEDILRRPADSRVRQYLGNQHAH